jgi:hypothetical protein
VFTKSAFFVVVVVVVVVVVASIEVVLMRGTCLQLFSSLFLYSCLGSYINCLVFYDSFLSFRVHTSRRIEERERRRRQRAGKKKKKKKERKDERARAGVRSQKARARRGAETDGCE